MTVYLKILPKKNSCNWFLKIYYFYWYFTYSYISFVVIFFTSNILLYFKINFNEVKLHTIKFRFTILDNSIHLSHYHPNEHSTFPSFRKISLSLCFQCLLIHHPPEPGNYTHDFYYYRLFFLVLEVFIHKITQWSFCASTLFHLA